MNSTLGRVITGRSTPGYPVRYRDNPNPYGVPRTEEERAMQHYSRFGTTALPPRGTRLQQLQGPDWGAFVAGLFIGGIITAVLVTKPGRGVAGAAAARVERRLRR